MKNIVQSLLYLHGVTGLSLMRPADHRTFCFKHFMTCNENLETEPEPWSLVAYNHLNDTVISKGVKIEASGVNMNQRQQHSFSSPREWMEAMEIVDETCGAYTVMRCDVKTKMIESKVPRDNFSLWGEEFHMKRLSSSYKMLFVPPDAENDHAIEKAVQESQCILSAILSKASKLLKYTSTPSADDEVYVIMITLLWQPRRPGDVQDILVRGHAYCSHKPCSSSMYHPVPTTAVVSFLETDEAKLLPKRYDQMPHAKASSWCRLRRPLEKLFRLHSDDIGEVILVRSIMEKVELLEGLTSNLFVVYKDGTIRTSFGPVLHGYARKLVVEAAHRLGYTVSNEPIYLKDASRGLWKEVFLTSSIRIIISVGKVMTPISDRFSGLDGIVPYQELWVREHECMDSQQDKHGFQLWRALYKDILQHYGDDN